MHQEAHYLGQNSFTEKNPYNHGRELGSRATTGNSHALLHVANEDYIIRPLLHSNLCHCISVHQSVRKVLEIKQCR